MDRKDNKKIVELVKPSYQATKSEQEEEFDVKVPGETVLERMSALTHALMQPVKIRWIDKPRKRRV